MPASLDEQAPLPHAEVTPLRAVAKAVAERVLVRTGATAIARRGTRGATIIFSYHNIVPQGERPVGERSLHLPVGEFSAQLDVLQASHEIVALDQVLERRDEPAARPRAVITFDDAYTGALTAGLAELRTRGLPATIFVAPGFVGGYSFWWDEVCPLPEDGFGSREYALGMLAGIDARVRDWASESMQVVARSLPDHARCADETLLAAAAAQPGITLGAHSWSHPNLAAIDPALLRGELTEPLRWLRARHDRVLPMLALPYGRSSTSVEQAARRAGYRAILANGGGWVPRTGASSFVLPRLNVAAGTSLEGFRLRASGLLRH